MLLLLLFIPFTAFSSVFIYNDLGVSQKGVFKLKKALHKKGMYNIVEITANKLLKNGIPKNIKVFIMPGGADLYYCKKLNGKCNKIIKNYVANGGRFFGICAGAYYASSFCVFHQNDKRGYEVIGKRELAFYPGIAEGPTLSDYFYNSEKGSRITKIETTIFFYPYKKYQVYYNGGCHFKNVFKYKNTKVLAYFEDEKRRISEYNNKKLPAIIECSYGKGKAILSGVHPEYEESDFLLFSKIIEKLKN